MGAPKRPPSSSRLCKETQPGAGASSRKILPVPRAGGGPGTGLCHEDEPWGEGVRWHLRVTGGSLGNRDRAGAARCSMGSTGNGHGMVWGGSERPLSSRSPGSAGREVPGAVPATPTARVPPAPAAGTGTKNTRKGFSSPLGLPQDANGIREKQMAISLHDPALAETSDFSFRCWRSLEGPVQLSPPGPGDALQSRAVALEPSPDPTESLRKGSAESGGRAAGTSGPGTRPGRTRCH